MRTVLLLLVLPLAFLATSLLPGRRFLPILPAAYAPLSIEDPEAARAARDDADFPAVDRVLSGLAEDAQMRADWLSGTLPAWDERGGLGMPLAARTAAWYPPRVLGLILPPDLAAALIALVTLFMAGAGMWLCLRIRGASRGASLLGAWAFQAGGFALVSLHVPARVDAALWLPFALAGVERVVIRARHGGLMCAGAIALSFLAGCFPVAVLVAAATFFCAMWRSVEARSARVVASVAGWIAIGIAAGAVAWMPLLEAQAESTGARQGPELTAAQSLPFASTATILVPDLFGRATDPWPASQDPVTWWLTPRAGIFAAQSASTIDWCLFAGAGVLVLALAGILGRPRASALPLAMLLLALGFAQGWPVVRLLYHVPGFDLASPAIGAAVAWVCWPMLAAIGLDALIERRPGAMRAALTASVALLIVSGFFASSFEPDLFAQKLPQILAERHGVPLQTVAAVVPAEHLHPGFVRALHCFEQLATVSAGVIAVLLTSLFLARRSALAATVPWLVVVALEGGLLASAHLAPRHLEGRPVFPRSDAMASIATAAGDGRVVRFGSAQDDAAELAPPDLLAAYGIRDLTPRSPLVPQSLVELLATVDPHSLQGARVDRLTDVKVLEHRALDLLRVTCVISARELTSTRLRLVWSRPGFFVHARSGSMPLARVAPPEAIVTSAEVAALQLVADPARDPRAGVVIDTADLPPVAERPRASTGPFVPGEVQVASRAPDRLDARVTGSSGGWLVFHEQWYPGWKATVNGADAPVVRADHVCRAVAIPPGDSVVRTKYEATSLRLGAALTLGACAVALFLGWRSARKTPVRAAV